MKIIVVVAILGMSCVCTAKHEIPLGPYDVIEECSSSKFETTTGTPNVVSLKIHNELQSDCRHSGEKCQLWKPVYFQIQQGTSPEETIITYQEHKDAEKILIGFAGGYLRVSGTTSVNSSGEMLYLGKMLISRSKNHKNFVKVFCRMGSYEPQEN